MLDRESSVGYAAQPENAGFSSAENSVVMNLRTFLWNAKGVDRLIRTTGMWAAIGAVIYLLLYFFVDRPIALWIHDNCSRTWIPIAGRYISYSAKGSFVTLGLALCFILILIGDSGLKRRETKVLLHICICLAIGIIIGEGLKFLLARYRPIMLFQHDLYGLHFFSTKWPLNSTPSGHTIRAFALATALSMLYRRFIVVFISIAVLIGLSRIAVIDHYPSDVVFGAYLGIFTALWTHVHYFRRDAPSSR